VPHMPLVYHKSILVIDFLQIDGFLNLSYIIQILIVTFLFRIV